MKNRKRKTIPAKDSIVPMGPAAMADERIHNVILGHLIPAGTAFKPHLELKVKHLVEAPPPKGLEEIKEVKDAEEKAEAAVKEALGIN